MATKSPDVLKRLGKRQRANYEIRKDDVQSMPSAIASLKQFKAPKFDQTVEVVMHLGIDPRSATRRPSRRRSTPARSRPAARHSFARSRAGSSTSTSPSRLRT